MGKVLVQVAEALSGPWKCTDGSQELTWSHRNFLHSGNCLEWSHWERLGTFSIPSGCLLCVLAMLIMCFSYADYVLPSAQEVLYQARLFMKALMRLSLVGMSRGKEQSLPSPQDCHQEILLFICQQPFPKEKGRDC